MVSKNVNGVIAAFVRCRVTVGSAGSTPLALLQVPESVTERPYTIVGSETPIESDAAYVTVSDFVLNAEPEPYCAPSHRNVLPP